MQLNQLQFLLTLSREESYAKAAKRLNISRSTISMAIKNLEDELDVQLIAREKKGIKFTEKGRQILEEAVEIEMNIREMENLKTAFLDEMTGRVIIEGASHHYNLFMVDVILYLQERFPRLQIGLEDHNNLEIIHNVAQGRCLTGIVQMTNIDEMYYQTEMTVHDLVFSPLEKGAMFFAVGQRHPFCGKAECLDLATLLECSTLLSRYESSEIFLKYFRQRGYQGNIAVVNDAYTSRHLVDHSDYYATLLPQFAFYEDNRFYQQHLSPVALDDFDCTYQCGWVTRKSGYSLREQRIIEELQSTLSLVREGALR